MTYNKGDRVQIKSMDILPLDGYDYHDYLYFAPLMSRYCGMIVTIKCPADPRDATSKRVYEVSGNSWLWHEDWLININPFLLDEDFEI